MEETKIVRLGSLKDVAQFQDHVESLGLKIPCDRNLEQSAKSPLARCLFFDGQMIGNRIATQPMEGWDGASDGNPTDATLRRWRRFGTSGAKLIWGGEAIAVRPDGRANPNQLMLAPHTLAGIGRLRQELIAAHRDVTGSDEGLLIGLQLTHSGRYSRPSFNRCPEPRILYHHPLLDRRLGLPVDYPLLKDGEIREIIEDFHHAARMAWQLGFDFVDIKHCHGYLGHEFLSSHTREGPYGGSFENRTRFLREVVQGIRSVAPGLQIGVRLSAFDSVPFRAGPANSPGQRGPGTPEIGDHLLPYRWGFGINPFAPVEADLAETARFMELLKSLDIHLVNVTAGSPYYNPHIQRPALYPPSDGYEPPQNPLAEVARHFCVVRYLKHLFPELIFVGSAYSYLQDFLPYVAQAVVRLGWVDMVAMGRMLLTYPELLSDVLRGDAVQHKRVCRTFSDCTTAPRKGLPSGCYPLDPHYKRSQYAAELKRAKGK